MPPQGPPGPQPAQPQPATMAAATAASEPCPASAADPEDTATNTDHRPQHDAATRASQAPNLRTAHGNHDQSVLRRRRDSVGAAQDAAASNDDPCRATSSCQDEGGDVQDQSVAPPCSPGPGGNGYAHSKSSQKQDLQDQGQNQRQHGKDAAKLNLLTYHDVPQHLRFNPYIVTGYRPMSDFWGSVRSLFYLHNETVNIVTHGEPV